MNERLSFGQVRGIVMTTDSFDMDIKEGSNGSLCEGWCVEFGLENWREGERERGRRDVYL